MERFVVDTNVLFSFFWRSSWIRETILKPDVMFFSPEKVFEELDRHSPEICSKAKIDLEEYKFWRTVLSWEIIEVKFNEFKEKLTEASKITPHEKDTELFAVALLYNIPIWSNEVRLAKQRAVKVFSNNDIFTRFGFI